MEIIIANIAWDENGWEGEFHNKNSGHRHVAKGGLPHECFNFKFDAPWNTPEKIYGYFQRKGGINKSSDNIGNVDFNGSRHCV